MKDLNSFSCTPKSDELEDTFIFSFIHDLKNMMVPITSRIELLQRPGIAEEKRQRILKQMSSDCETMADALNKMVAICRSRSHLEAYSPQKVDLSFLVAEAVDFISEPTAQKEVTINYNIQDKLSVLADREAILGVVINLLGNAVKFSHRGDTIRVMVEKEEIYARLIIKDQGVGLNLEQIKLLLEDNKYFHTAGTEGEMGSGFGLMLCESHLRRGGSKLEYGNNQDGGAYFSFILPLAE